MQVKCGRKRFLLSLVACGLCLPVPAVEAGVTIQNVLVDGQVRPLSAAGRDRNPLRVSSTARSVRFQFTSDVPAVGAAVRLRFKLEGHDDTWRDLPVKMRMLVLICDRNGQIVVSHEFDLEGETPGWRARVADGPQHWRQGRISSREYQDL